MAKHTCHECESKTREVKPTKTFYKHPLFWVGIATAGLFMSSYFVPLLASFRSEFIHYWKRIWWAVLLGFVIGGFISAFIPTTFISKLFGERKASTIPKAIGFGFLFSACSHGILAISMAFYKRGASTAATIAFLLAAPWANLAFVPVIFAFFGMYGFVVIGGSLLIALITGLIFQQLEKHKKVEISPHTIKAKKNYSAWKDIKKHYAALKKKSWKTNTNVYFSEVWALNKMVLYWILIGTVLAALVGAYVPLNFMQTWMGPTFVGLLITVGIAVVIEICSEGSFPIAFEIFDKTGALGNAFAFLNAGVATDYTELGLIWRNIGKKTALWLLAIALPQILLLAVVMNWLL